MKFSVKDFFSKCDKIRRKLRILSHLLKKFLMVNLIFCADCGQHYGWCLWNASSHKKPSSQLQLSSLLSCNAQKQPPEVFYENRCSWKFSKIHRKIPVPGSLFNKTTLLKKRLLHRWFPVNFAKFLRARFLQNTPGRLFLNAAENLKGNNFKGK